VKKALLLKTAAALALATPMVSMAESQLAAQGANSTASARLNIRVVIPRVLFLGVGAGAGALNDPLAANGTSSTVTFDYTNNPQAVGGGATNPAASVTGAVVPVRVVGNNGTVSLVAATTGALTNATSDTIPWSEISATSSANTLPSPVIPATGSGTAVPLTPNVGTRVTRLAADWTFSYANSAVVAPGTYGTTNGQITYTASMP
jgi:hypothetical protein